ATASGFSSTLGRSPSGLSFRQDSSTSGCDFVQSVTIFLVVSSVLTHSAASVGLSLAQSARRSFSANQRSTSGPTGWPRRLPLAGSSLYFTIGPSCRATRKRSLGLFAPQLEAPEAAAL